MVNLCFVIPGFSITKFKDYALNGLQAKKNAETEAFKEPVSEINNEVEQTIEHSSENPLELKETFKKLPKVIYNYTFLYKEAISFEMQFCSPK